MNLQTFKKLEFDKILNQLAHLTTTQIGKQLALNLKPSTNVTTIKKMLLETEDLVTLNRVKGGLHIPALQDISMHIKRIEINASLNGKEISEIGLVLKTAKQIVNFFEQLDRKDIILFEIDNKINQLVILNDLIIEIFRVVSNSGDILDDASFELKQIRLTIKRTEQQIREKLDDLLKSKQAQLSEQLITQRDDRFVLPVKQEYKNTFGGVPIDQSASGQTIYIEPEAIFILNNKLKSLHQEEQSEILKILSELTEKLKPYTANILHNHYILGELDFIQAKATFAKLTQSTLPHVSEQFEVALYGARHPLIDPTIVVPNDIIIGQTYQAIVITGPNTGGKTILLKTLGLLQLMGQSGLHIPTKENSQIGIFSQIFTDIGDEQSIEQNLSTFSSHMTNINHILSRIDDTTLVLLDEVGSGTDPKEGASLAMAIMDYLLTFKCYFVATTHYPELKMYSYHKINIINASMEFDSTSFMPTYKFLMGIPGLSNAIAIAKQLHLPDFIIDKAKQYIDHDERDFNDMIMSLEKLRQTVEKEKEQVAKDKAQVQILLDEVTQEKQLFEEQKDNLITQAKKDANQIIQTAEEQTQAIISDMRKLQLKQGKALIKEHEFIEKTTALSQLKHEESLRQNKVLQKAKRNKNLQIGDHVEVMSYGQRGIISEKINASTFVVQMGALKMKINVADLRMIDTENTKQKKYIPTLKTNRTPVTSQLDLRGQRYENALIELDRYLDAALLAGYPQVTIVHGRGTGAIREGVTKHLRKHRGVSSFEFAPINLGGNGATIVKFKD